MAHMVFVVLERCISHPLLDPQNESHNGFACGAVEHRAGADSHLTGLHDG
jgi:hypothetical protein